MSEILVVQIGNTDDKLTQATWNDYWKEVDILIRDLESARHFSGGPATVVPWQNWCWVFDPNPSMDIESFKKALSRIGKRYRQDSVCLIVGEAEFI